MAHHQIEITIVDGHAIPNMPPDGVMHVGDTVSYYSNQGQVTVRFDLPFTNMADVLHAGDQRELLSAGRFVGKCSITLDDGTEIGWSPEDPRSGGEHDVRP